jgi:hypothetical protein
VYLFFLSILFSGHPILELGSVTGAYGIPIIIFSLKIFLLHQILMEEVYTAMDTLKRRIVKSYSDLKDDFILHILHAELKVFDVLHICSKLKTRLPSYEEATDPFGE